MLAGGGHRCERFPDGKGDAGHLDVEKEGLAVRGERRSGHLGAEVLGQFFFPQERIRNIVMGEDGAVAFRGEADQAVDAAPIFGDPDIAPRRDHWQENTACA